jgi:predicted PurR-regulated permease PerM
MWGIAGALLATPLLTVLRILCDHVESMAPLSELLDR